MSDFEEIYDEYYDGIYKFSLALCHNKEQAEDIVQESENVVLVYIFGRIFEREDDQ